MESVSYQPKKLRFVQSINGMYAFEGEMEQMELLGVPGVYLTRRCLFIPMSNISEIGVSRVVKFVEPEAPVKPAPKKRGRPKKVK